MELLQNLADEAAGGFVSGLSCVLGDWKQLHDSEAESRLRAETEVLEQQLKR